MKDLQSRIAQRWRHIIYLLIAFLLILMIQDIVREIIIFNREIQIIEEELQQNVYDNVENMVFAANEDFTYILDHLHTNAEAHAKEALSGLAFAADSLSSINAGSLNDTEIQENILLLTQTYNIADDDHQHFVYDTAGNQLLNGEDNTISTQNMLDAEDALGKEFIALLLDEISDSEDQEGIVSMYEIEDDELKEYIVYGKLVEDTDIVLATYISFEQFSEKEKHRALAQIEDIYDRNTNTIYVLSTDGEVLYHQNEAAIGLDLENDTYPIWQRTLQIIVNFTNENDQGFLTYDFYSNYVNGVVTEKIAYVSVIEEWDMIVGASSDTDLYDDILMNFRNSNYRTVMLIKLPAYAIMIGLSLILYRIVKNNVFRSQKAIEEEKRLYQKFADLTSEIIIITNKQGVLIYTNHLGTDIIFGDRSENTPISFDQIMVEEDGYYILYGVKRDMFVKYITEEIEFNGDVSNLYIVSDVTEMITTERQLEALSMKDELTQLGNRRLMVKDYTDDVLPFVKNGGLAHMAMIDLDDFKPANDLYGHSFGDFVLQEISNMFNHVSSKNVRFYRIGGDEFAIMFTSMTDDQVLTFMKKLQDAVGNHKYSKDVHVGFSAGVTRIIIKDKRRRFSDFYDEADQLLYQSKDEGKNKISM